MRKGLRLSRNPCQWKTGQIYAILTLISLYVMWHYCPLLFLLPRWKVFRIVCGHEGAANRIRRVLRRAGVRRRAHDLRATYATRVLRLTGNVHLVARLLGHASIATTERYLGLGEIDLPELWADVEPIVA